MSLSAARLPARPQVSRLEGIELPRRRSATPHDVAVRDAKRALNAAQSRHRARVRARRRDLRRTERAYNGRVSQAQREVRNAERTEEKAISATERAVVNARRGAQLGRYRRYSLYEDHVETPDGILPVVPELRAVVADGERIRSGALPQTLARIEGRSQEGRHLGAGKIRSSRTYLLIETADVSFLLPCEPELEAREFAQAINVAAFNAGRFAAKRADATVDIQASLIELRERRRSAVAAAQQALEAVEADTAPVVAARQALAEVEADVGEIERARTAFEALERQVVEPRA